MIAEHLGIVLTSSVLSGFLSSLALQTRFCPRSSLSQCRRGNETLGPEAAAGGL